MTDDTRKTAETEARLTERDVLRAAVNDLGDSDGQRPEALRQLAESARDGEDAPKSLVADHKTKPQPVPNPVKHRVATRILHEGAEGEHPDPHAEGVDQLPDRIIDRG